jgi:hypothetical protein
MRRRPNRTTCMPFCRAVTQSEMHRSRTPEDFQEEIDFLRNQLDTVIVNHRVDWGTALLYVLAEPHDTDWYRRYVHLLEYAATHQEQYGNRLVIVYGSEDVVR